MWKVSLLVTTYNVSDHLKTTLASIESQDYAPIEVLIQDGGSTDGTLDIIKDFAQKHGNSSDTLYVSWESAPDAGLYDAMNKAYRRSTGDIIAVCNDRLNTPDAVSKLVNAIRSGGSNCIGAHSDLIYVENEQPIRFWHMGHGKLKDGWMPGHPTLFLKRCVYEKYGTYDTSFHCAADYEFMVRFLKDSKNTLAYVPEVLVSMYYGGTSTAGLKSYLISFKESYLALKKNHMRLPFIITLKKTVRALAQFIRHE